MMLVFVLAALCVLGALTGVHWYLWRRLVRDVSAPGGAYRRIGTVALVVLPLTTVGAMVAGSVDALPFTVERVLAWPGFLWIALVLYLTLALLVGEAVRPLLTRWLERRSAAARSRVTTVSATVPAPERAARPAREGDGGSTEPGEPLEPVEPAQDPVAVPVPVPAGEAPAGDGAVATGPEAGTAAGGSAPAVTDPVALTGQDGPGAPPQPAGAPDTEGEHSDTAGPSRRLFVARTVAVAASAVAATTVGVGAYGVLNGPSVKRVTIPLAKLPRGAHGYRIAVVSDVHLGPILGRSHTQRIVDTVNGTQPDLVTIVGDLVDGSVADLGSAAEPLAQLRSRHGTYFVTGNHDYRSGAEEWLDHLRELDVRLLLNSRVEMPGFDLAGVNDLAGEDEGQGPDFERALGDRDPARTSVLLAHQPVQIHDAVDYRVDLQLSGHTHGGQMWPGPYLAALANPTVAGLERYGDTQLYVSRGAGAWGPPVRVGAESDITVVELASRQT